MATVARENIGTLTDKLTVNLTPEDYKTAFEAKLKNYSKTATIPGFRKGNVPAGMIKKMYGAGIFEEEVLRTVEKELFSYLNTEKPEIFGQPLPLTNDVALNMADAKDYAFEFEIGLKPTIEIASLAEGNFTKYAVSLNNESIEDEVNRLRIKGGKMTEPEQITDEENVLNVKFTEVDEKDVAVEGGIEKENSLMLKYFGEKLQKELQGKKVGESIVFTLKDAFTEDKLKSIYADLGLDADDETAAGKRFKLTIDKIGSVEKRELQEDFFKEIFPGKDIATEEDFRIAIKEDFEKYFAEQTKNHVHQQFYDYLVNNTKMEFPEEFLKRWLQTAGEKAKTEEEVEAEFPTFKKQLAWTLISDKIEQDENVAVTKDELREQMRGEVMGYFGQMNMGEDMSWLDGYLDRMMSDEKHIEATHRKLAATKLFGALESKVKPAEKEISEKDFFDILEKEKAN